MEVEEFVYAMLVLGYARIAARGARQELIRERAQGGANRSFVEIHHRLAIRFLVAGVHQSVERQRIVFRRGDFLLDEGTENGGVDVSELLIQGDFLEGWCGREASTLHGIAPASPSSWCVCQFRHYRTAPLIITAAPLERQNESGR